MRDQATALSGSNQRQPQTRIGREQLRAADDFIVAFRLRGGHAGWVPLVVLGFVILLALRIAASIAAWNAAGRNGIAVGTELLVGWIIPLLCLTLMLGGLRGWLWLRANGIRRGF